MHSSSLVDTERPQLVYLGSCETSVRLRKEISIAVGMGASQSWDGGSGTRWWVCSSGVGERDWMSSPVVMGCTPVSAMIRTRSGALWRAPPPLAVFRMAACMSWQAALWRLMRSASWAWHSPAMWVQESGLWQSGHVSVRVCPYLLANLPLYSCPYRNFRTDVPSQGW